MLLYLSPSNWLLILLAVLLTGYIKISSTQNQKPVFFAKAHAAQTTK